VTDLGVLGAGRLGAVDRHGVVTPAGADWAFGWWVGAEDRWHVPPVEPTVRQGLVDGTPVVETRVRVVGGDIVHRAYAVTGPGSTSALVVDITNDTPVPVAIALVIHGERGGRAPVQADGDLLRVGTSHTIRLPRPPSDWVAPAAFLPLPHRASLRVTLSTGVDAPEAGGLPDADRVAGGWRTQAGVGLRMVLPDPVLTATADAARCFLLLHD
jgi:hypothetical protein